MDPRYIFFPLGGLIIAVIFIIVFIVLLFLIASLAFWGTRHAHRRSSWGYRDEALDILRTRYAKGEITKEQYLEMEKALEEK
ncbi:MAG TPA: SHOCT domain-containing protein [archaeon]|nr:SHOCT domain-containing protein [archaeon]